MVDNNKICIVGYQSKCRFRIRREKNFSTANFESLPRPQKLVSYQRIIFKLIICMPNFKAKRFTKKKLFKIYQHW